MIKELFVLSLFISLIDAGSYIVTFPDSLIPGVSLGARVTIIGATGPVHVVATLRHSPNDSEITTLSATVANGVPRTLPIKVPEGLPRSLYRISITGSAGLSFRNESSIHYEDKSLFIFLQTDKTRYSAGQEVKYRAILLHPNLLGYNGPLTVTIYDGKDNKIEVTDHLKTKDGVVMGKLLLSREPVFGNWRINVNARTEAFTKSFEVNDYVVPRFSVVITLPSDLKWTSTYLNIGIKAKFTFNANVLGNCTIQIYDKYDTYRYLEYWKQITGEVNFTIPMADITSKFWRQQEIIVRALVTDNATALTIAAEENLKFASDTTTYKPTKTITIVMKDNRNTFVPGLTYHSTIFVGYDNDEPIGTSGIIHVTPTVTTAEETLCLLNNPPTKWLDVKTTTLQNFTLSFDESGYAALNVPISAHTDKVEFLFSYGAVQQDVTLYSVSSVPGELLRLNVNKAHVRVGEKVSILAEATALLSGNVFYEIYARGILLKTINGGLFHARHPSIDLEITGDMVPQVYVVATHMTQIGNLLSDYVTLKVSGSPFKNKVSISYNMTSLAPRGGLRMDIKADPNSTVYLMIEDEKNRLISTENDIFLNEIAEKVIKPSQNTRRTLFRRQKIYRRNINFAADNIFKDSGVVVLSNIDMFPTSDFNSLLMFDATLPRKCIHITTTTTTTASYYPGSFPTWVPGIVPTPAPGVTYAPNNIPTPAPGQTYAPGRYPTWVPGMVPTPAPGVTFAPNQVLVTTPPTVATKEILRTRFPETWVWEEYHIGQSGSLSITKAAPDAITSWISSVFATNPNTGFGISEIKQKITVKKSFFLSMDLPSSIILGEEILVQITVFSYMKLPQQVFLQVDRSDDPTNPIPAATMVQPNSGHSTYVRVTPHRLGVLKIQVHAKAGFFSTSATDALEKEVEVLPLGVHKTTNDQRLVDISSGGQPFTETLILKDHPNMINGTKHVFMKITGDFMVPSIDGLQNLIQMPHGCGEQTMVNFAPDIFLTKYMNVTGQLSKDIEDKALNFIRSGYQHELSYRHIDGAFSIWGSRDNYGSTWLTAYVLKCFHQAKGLISIDNNVLTTAMRWLLSRQNHDGSFLEQLSVYYVDHRRTGTGIKLTAFTLISIVECQDTPNVQASVISSALEKGKRYLETKLSSISDAYTLAIVCYALAKSGSTYGQSCFSQLESSKHNDGGSVYWTESSPIGRRQTYARALQSRAPARDIETTAYALLTYMALGHHAQAFPIVKWLVSQRNPYGGFHSTQDTVITIQALTEYAQKHAHIASNYGVQFNAFGMGFMHSYSSTAKNYDSIHQVEVPSGLDNVIIQAMGNGIAVIDVVQSFYISSVGNGAHISVNASIEKESLNSLTVQAKISWSGFSDSRMIMMEVEMPTGFVVDGDFFKSQTHIRRHEANGRKVAIYLDGIRQGSQSEVKVKMDRSDPVVKNQACHITVYDYYEPTQQAVTLYESGLLKRANICDVCPLCNFCTGSSGFSQIGIGK